MKIVYAGQQPPESFARSLFLAGPTPRSAETPSWRTEALRLLGEMGYDGVVFVPEPENEWRPDYDGQVEWEEEMLHLSDQLVFWIPRSMAQMPGLTTNTEWGVWSNTGRVVLGAPTSAERVRYQKYYATKFAVPQAETLPETLTLALERMGAGALRSAGERYVPLLIWNTPSFQQWYAAQKRAGNRLERARVHWTFRVGPQKRIVYLWALHVEVFVAKENRAKVNEFILGRGDISCVLMYRKGRSDAETEVVLVREFRSSVRNEEGFVFELPGGSSPKPGESPTEVAAEEVWEEAGLKIAPERFRVHGSRQVTAPFAAHHAHLFSVEMTEEEMEGVRQTQHIMRGNFITDSEQTYAEVHTLASIREKALVDWATLGMILSVLG